jgi:hypothetical protein
MAKPHVSSRRRASFACFQTQNPDIRKETDLSQRILVLVREVG